MHSRGNSRSNFLNDFLFCVCLSLTLSIHRIYLRARSVFLKRVQARALPGASPCGWATDWLDGWTRAVLVISLPAPYRGRASQAVAVVRVLCCAALRFLSPLPSFLPASCLVVGIFPRDRVWYQDISLRSRGPYAEAQGFWSCLSQSEISIWSPFLPLPVSKCAHACLVLQVHSITRFCTPEGNEHSNPILPERQQQ